MQDELVGRFGRAWGSAVVRSAVAAVSRRRPVGSGARRDGGVAARPVEALENRCLLSNTPIITELLAINNTGLIDENGDRGDWLEIYNPAAGDANLSGYYLTDSRNNLTKWQLPAVTVPSGGYLTVFADSKDRRVVGSNLHTNFSLNGGGGYLGLVGTDGVTVLSEYDYPQQVADLSYGVTVNQTTTKLLNTAAPVRALVPQNGNLGSTWTAPGFVDTSWTAGTTGVGYETETAGPPTGSGFSVRMVDTNGGTDGDIANIGEAAAILDGTAASGAFIVASDTTANRALINMGDGGSYTGDQAYPNGAGGTSADANDAKRSQFAIRAKANVIIPAGTYTIAVNTDDGFRLKIPGVTFTGRNGENTTGSPTPTPADTLVYGGTRGPGNTFAAFTVPAGGLTTTLQLDMFEQGGGDEVELSLASNARSTFSTSTFTLLADGTLGWSVKDPTSLPPPNYRSLIGTDLQTAMFNKANTAYVRTSFTVQDPGDFDEARFQIKYDDGYVAYLNGTEIARKNAPAAPVWNSAATGTHADAAALAYESVALPSSALVEGNNVLAIQGLNAATDQSDFLIYPEVQGLFTTVGAPTYFSTTTPGAANSTATSLGFVADTKFNVSRGFFSSSFPLTITTATPGATIRYTTDGTAPTATTGTVYTGPITISATTTLRAAAYKAGLQPSNVDTQSYIFMADVIRQPTTAPAGFPSASVNGQTFNYGMDQTIVNADPTISNDINAIPSVSLVIDPKDLFDATTGIYTHAGNHGRSWERPASIEFLYPDVTTQDIQSGAGVRIRGGFSRSGDNPKHAFHFYFRSEYGDGSFDHPIFGPTGADSFQQFDLRTFENYSWSFGGDSKFIGLRDQFSRDTQLAMGWQAERGDFYNLYINGQFWGIYNTDERSEADYAASYYGGAASDYDVVKVAPDQGYNMEATDGNLDAFTSLWTQVQGDMTSTANYQKLLGNNPDGTRNPAFPVLLDPKNLIDYMLTIYYGGNLDAPLSNFLSNQSPNNYFAVRNRVTNNQGFQFFAHDSEHTLLDQTQDRTGPGSGQTTGPNNGWPVTNASVTKANPQWMFQYLLSNPEFKLLVADRIQKYFFDGGALTPAAVSARLTTRRNQIDRAIYGESARWGDSKHTPAYTHDTWLTEINRIFNSYIPARTANVLTQVKNRGWFPTTISAPTFSKFGGTVPSGYSLTIANPNGAGTLYYTLDGSDPRTLGGGVSSTALTYAGAINISQTRRVQARVLNGTTWSPLEDATFVLDSSALHVTEVMYHPAAPPAGSPYTVDDFEYLELYNAGSTALDLSGMSFTAGVTLTFPAGTSLAAGARGVVVRNAAAFQSKYGAGVTILGVYTDKLSDGGEQVRLVSAAGATVFDFTYADSWYDNTDGGGYSLVARDPVALPTTLSAATAWRPSNDLGGKPGFVDLGTNPGAVVINEVLTNPDPGAPGGDWVELYNPTNSPVDVSGWFLSDSAADHRKYQIPAGTTIGVNGYLLFYGNDTFAKAGAPGVNTAFGLDDAGDSIRLSSVDSAGNAGGYQESESFHAATQGITFGRYTNTSGNVDFTALNVPTPGGPNNSGPVVGPVVINEMMYYPTTGQEFIELRNLTGQPQPLYDPQNPQNPWKFTNGIDFAFPAGATIPAFGYALVVGGDPAAFRTQNNVPAAVPIYGPYTAADGSNLLANDGERVTLSRPTAPDPLNGGLVSYIDVDSVKYETAAPWPTTPAGLGPSLSRVSGLAYGNEPTNWAAAASGGTPGRANLTNTAPTVNTFAGANLIEGGLYNASGTFNDADQDPDGSWTATVDYGDGTGVQPLLLTGHAFNLSHVYGSNNPPGSSAGYTVRVTVTDVAAASAFGTASVVVAPGAAAVQSIQVNDGNAQRSMVNMITVTFDRPVVPDAGAFTVVGRNGAGAGTLVSAAGVNVNTQGAAAAWVLSFVGTSVVGGSLSDGVYDLTVVGSKVHANTAAGPTASADRALAFHRLYSDADGDGDSDNFDLLQLRPTLLKPSTDPAYKWYFDYDQNGTVDNLDVFQIRNRRTITFQGY